MFITELEQRLTVIFDKEREYTDQYTGRYGCQNTSEDISYISERKSLWVRISRAWRKEKTILLSLIPRLKVEFIISLMHMSTEIL